MFRAYHRYLFLIMISIWYHFITHPYMNQRAFGLLLLYHHEEISHLVLSHTFFFLSCCFFSFPLKVYFFKLSFALSDFALSGCIRLCLWPPQTLTSLWDSSSILQPMPIVGIFPKHHSRVFQTISESIKNQLNWCI